MVSSTINGYAETILTQKWGQFMSISSGATWSYNGGTKYVGPSQFLGFGGGAFAIFLSMVGAYQNAGQLISSIEDSLDTWLEVYEGGAYKDVIPDAEKSSSMEQFLTMFTWDIILFAIVSMVHSMYIIGVGFAGSFFIMNKVKTWDTANDATQNVPLSDGFRALVFGVVLGSVNYMAGNVTKNTIESVMLSLGFTTHEYDA